jgi:hypothetical protein
VEPNDGELLTDGELLFELDDSDSSKPEPG